MRDLVAFFLNDHNHCFFWHEYADVTGAQASVMKLHLDLSCLPSAMTQDLATVTRATDWGKEEDGRGVCLEGRWLGAGAQMDYWKWPRSSPFGVTRAFYKPSVSHSCCRTRTLSLLLHQCVELRDVKAIWSAKTGGRESQVGGSNPDRKEREVTDLDLIPHFP